MQWFFRSFPFQLLFCLGTGLLFLGLASFSPESRPRRERVALVGYIGEENSPMANAEGTTGTVQKQVTVRRIHPANRVPLIRSDEKERSLKKEAQGSAAGQDGPKPGSEKF